MSGSKTLSRKYMEKSTKLLPEGVASNFRFLGMDDTLTVSHGKGCELWDIDGNKYIDIKMGFGPVILGHAHSEVNQAVHNAIENGTVYAMNNELEFELAEKIVKHCPSVNKVRFANSGTEATMHAIRAARGFSDKSKIVKFEGCYHGMHDYLLYSTSPKVTKIGPRREPIVRQQSWGIPELLDLLVITLPYNSFDVTERVIKDKAREIAAIIVEPMMGNCAGIEPVDGWLEFLRDLCTEHDIILIFDEVKTGFRMGLGGAQVEYGVMPDLSCYAKSMGNGFPVAAFGGRRDIMDDIAYGKIAHGGTYCGNTVAMAAGIATISIMEREPVHKHINKVGKILADGIKKVCDLNNVQVKVMGPPSMPGFVFNVDNVVDYRSCMKGDYEFYELTAKKMLNRGFLYEDDFREPLFPSYSLTENHAHAFVDAFADVIPEVKAELTEK